MREERSVLGPASFHARYVSPREPVVLRGAVSNVPAMGLWTDQYLKDKCVGRGFRGGWGQL